MNNEKQKLCTVLDEILWDNDTKILKNASLIVDKESLYKSYSSKNWIDLNLEEYSVHASSNALISNKIFLEKFFRPFVDPNSNKIGVLSVVLSLPNHTLISVTQFIADYVIRAVVFLGSKRVSELLVDWKSSNNLTYTQKFQLDGY